MVLSPIHELHLQRRHRTFLNTGPQTFKMPRPATRSHAGTAVSQPISNFTRVSKSHASLDPAIKKIALEPSTPAKKRKAASIEQEETHPRVTRRTVSFPPSSDDELATVKRACRRQEPTKTPAPAVRPIAKGKKVAKAEPRRKETIHKPVEATIIAKSKQQGKKIQTKIDGTFKKLNTPTKKSSADALPPQLAEVLDLHKAFIKTLMIQIAHNGTSSPIDVNDILPNVSRTWGKRQVTLDDIRRCIALESSPKDSLQSPFSLGAYARGRVLIAVNNSQLGPIIPETLCQRVAENLRELANSTSGAEVADAQRVLESLSLADVPLEHITQQGSTNLLIKKGHAALSDIKSGIAAKQQEKQIKQSTISTPTHNPDGTKMSLLDRLRLKQLAKANEPLPPSGPELQRRAALNRVSDVAATISMLSLSNPMSLPRQAFTMTVIMEKLKDSLRTPISKEEGATCVRLIASEVAPEWLRIVTIGGRENVVVQRTGQPVDRVIQERVQKLMA